MPEKILIFQFGDLGDILLTVPALRALRERYPDSHMTLLGKAASGKIAHDLGVVDEVISTDKQLFDRLTSLVSPRAWSHAFKLVVALRRQHPDTVVLFHHLVTRWGAAKFAALTLASGAPQRVGVDNGRGWFLTHTTPDEGFGARHESEYWMKVVDLLGAEGDIRMEFPLSSDHERRAEVLLGTAPAGTRYVAVHPGTGPYGPGRRWDPARFADAVVELQRTHHVVPVVVGTSDDELHARIAIDRMGPGVIDLVGRTDLHDLAAVLQRCSVLIANDGGVGHVAAALGVPVVTIFGPSNDRAWKPLTATVVASDLPCRPCFYREFSRGLPNGCATRECLSQVSPYAVASTAANILLRSHAHE